MVEWQAPIWRGNAIINRGGLPLWSGKIAPPPVGTIVICADKAGTRVRITGYSVEHGWLMAEGFRVADELYAGNLAGIEIRGVEQ